jgi:hypothetical protein
MHTVRMPGGRLTHEDRRHIAEGLAEGLPFSAIATRIGRPTSTVTREVARNGGADGYRADTAQRATKRRARRASPTTPDPHLNGRPDVLRFEEQFVAMMAQTGLPRMPARVLTCLLTGETGSLTAADLVHRLQVSPASISKAVGYLEQIHVVRRERDHRRERYVIDDDVWYRACEGQVRICELWADFAARGAQVLGIDTPAGVRLDYMSRFFGFVGRDMAAAAQHRRHVFATERADAATERPRPSTAAPTAR